MSTFYVCYCPVHRSCGRAHRTRGAAETHCQILRAKHGCFEIFPIDAESQGKATKQAVEQWGVNPEVQKELDEERRKAKANASGDASEQRGEQGGNGSDGGSQGEADNKEGDADQDQGKGGEDGKGESEQETDDTQGADIQKDVEKALDKAKQESQASMPPPEPPYAAMAEALRPHLTGTLAPEPKGSAKALDEALAPIIRRLAKRIRAQEQRKASEEATTTVVIEDKARGTTKQVKGGHKQYSKLLELIAMGETRLLLFGATGSGKTTGAEKACNALERTMYLQGPVTDKFELSGYNDGAGNYQDTPLFRWAKAKPGSALVIDEIDSCDPNALTSINAALANGWAIFPNEQVSIPPEHVVIATANTVWGSDSTFTGRMQLDGATLDRFICKLKWDYDEGFESKLARDCFHGTIERVAICRKIRRNIAKYGVPVVWGPRSTFGYCRLRYNGWTHADALEVSSLAMLEQDQYQKVTDGVE